MLILNADGGCAPNPGQGRIGFTAMRNGVRFHSVSSSIGEATNNIAEWKAAIAALNFALHEGDIDVSLRMDSRLVVEQLTGRWKVKNGALKPLRDEAQQILLALAGRGVRLQILWVPREQNEHADALTR